MRYRIERNDSGDTSREREVMALFATGISQAEIGRQLSISRQRVGQLVAEGKRKQKLTLDSENAKN